MQNNGIRMSHHSNQASGEAQGGSVGRGRAGAAEEGIVWGAFLQVCFQAGAQALFSEQG